MNSFLNLFTRKPKQSFTTKFLNRRFKGVLTASDNADGGYTVALVSDPNVQTILVMHWQPSDEQMDPWLRQLCEVAGAWLDEISPGWNPPRAPQEKYRSDCNMWGGPSARQMERLIELLERQATANGQREVGK